MKLRHLALPAILAAVLGNPAAIASPSIHDVVVDSAQETLVVVGRGFGTKSQAAPVLFDFGEHAYENGQKNDFHSRHYVDGQNMRPTFMDSNMRVYDLMARTPRNTGDSWGNNGPIYSADPSAQRHAGVNALYRMRRGARIGQPMAYGGYANPPDARFRQPDGNKQIYVAWWLKPWIDPYQHRALILENVQGEFKLSPDGLSVGERFTSSHNGGRWAGHIVGWWTGQFDQDGQPYTFLDVAPDVAPWSGIAGATITGVESGATATISGIRGYTGSHKYARIWQGWVSCPSSATRAALGVSSMSHECTDAPGLWHNNSSPSHIRPGEWHMFEWMIDNEAGKMIFKINGQKMSGWHRDGSYDTLHFDPAQAASETLSPTLHTLGMDTNAWGLQTFDISEIYMDSSWQRVVLADAPSLSNVKHLELQRPISWVDDQVAFELRLGALQGTRTADELYVFVFDRNGQVNAEGFPLPAAAMGLVEPVLLPPDPITVN